MAPVAQPQRPQHSATRALLSRPAKARATLPGHIVTRSNPDQRALSTGRTVLSPHASYASRSRCDADMPGPAGLWRRPPCHVTTRQLIAQSDIYPASRVTRICPARRLSAAAVTLTQLSHLGNRPCGPTQVLPVRAGMGESLPPIGKRRRMPDLVASCTGLAGRPPVIIPSHAHSSPQALASRLAVHAAS